MIGPQIGRMAFRIGFYLAFVSGILSLLTDPSSPERVISILTFLISVLFLLIVTLLVRISRWRDRSPNEEDQVDPTEGGDDI